MINFSHLHVHTQYSILDGACNINKLLDKAIELEQPAIAITDQGNMFGVVEFHNACKKKGIKPILGCEMDVSPQSRFIKDGKNFSGHHLILLAKNERGYHNLIKLDSLAFAKEAKYRTSRIDKELLFEHSEGLICCSACLGGELPQKIMATMTWGDGATVYGTPRKGEVLEGVPEIGEGQWAAVEETIQ